MKNVTAPKKLAICVASVLGLSAPTAYASHFVTNCNDSGTGSLRTAVSAVVAGDSVVDMTGLTTASTGCSSSTITLSTGAIASTITTEIFGPTSSRFIVSQASSPYIADRRVFTQTGSSTNTLLIYDLTIQNGRALGSKARGGCIYSAGHVLLSNVTVTNCTAEGAAAYGGAISGSTVNVSSSEISHSLAESDKSGGAAEGGGIYGIDVVVNYSYVHNNQAKSAGGIPYSSGGGIAGKGETTLHSSTISTNFADVGAGIFVQSGSEGLVLVETTVANNFAYHVGGGVVALANLYAASSSIVGNSAVSATDALLPGKISPGAATIGSTVYLQSTLIANNKYNGQSNDLSSSSAAVTGANNLIYSTAASVPNDTIVGKCPRLGSLRNNGGGRPTIALQSQSAGIDQGNNILGDAQDQRGSPTDAPPYSYSRVSGAAADIGAYEVQQGEIIFTANFEGCP
jgi:hypothetical protein